MQGCAQEYFGITPDLTTMGKVIGGGLPVGAYGGKKEIMQMVAPAGKTAGSAGGEEWMCGLQGPGRVHVTRRMFRLCL